MNSITKTEPTAKVSIKREMFYIFTDCFHLSFAEGLAEFTEQFFLTLVNQETQQAMMDSNKTTALHPCFPTLDLVLRLCLQRCLRVLYLAN